MRLLAGAALLACASASGATTIGFGGYAGGATTFSQLGATITANGQVIDVALTPNGTNGIIADGTPRSTFTAVFDVLTNSVSVDLGDFGVDQDEIFLQAFGLGGTPLGSTSLVLASDDTVMHTLTINTPGISYVTFGSDALSLNGSSVYADNLTFDAPVPEPATWVMMLIGFVGIGWSLRQRPRTAELVA
jgi:hypothetical protein